MSPDTPATAAEKKRCRYKAKALGESCSSNEQCCTNQTNRICGLRNGAVTGQRCCGALGAKCGDSKDCCFGFGCGNDGFCHSQV